MVLKVRDWPPCRANVWKRVTILLSVGVSALWTAYAAAQESTDWQFACHQLKTSKFCMVARSFHVSNEGVDSDIRITIMRSSGNPPPRLSIIVLQAGRGPENRLCWGRQSSVMAGADRIAAFGTDNLNLSHSADISETAAVTGALREAVAPSMTVHIMPDCQPRAIDLRHGGFAAAWARLEHAFE